MSDTAVLYLRGMPRPLIREAKAAAARQGVTLTRLVARALESVLSAPQGEPEDDLATEMAWYEENRSRLVARYGGQHVAIRGHKVVDHDASFDALAERVFVKLGPRPIFIPRVEASDRVVRIRSPRVVRR